MSTPRTILAFPPVAVLLAGVAPAQGPAESVPAPLERALDAIQVDDLERDLAFIASDEMKGRDTPSPELEEAARFLAKRLEELGIEHGAEDGYFYEWTRTQYGLDLEETLAVLQVGEDETRLAWGEDYFLDRYSFDSRVYAGALVWGGALDPEAVDALAAGDVDKRWILAAPDDNVSRARRAALEEAGVLGVVVLPDPGAERTVRERHGESNERRARASLRRPRGRSSAVPIVLLSEDAATPFRALVPNDAEVGDALGANFYEACDYGELEDAVLENVCGLWPGSDPELRNDVIILSAHYDHVGWREDGTIYNGADDNGSGTTGLLAIAKALTEYGPMRRTVMLQWVSGEEKGLLGSEAWTKDPWLPDGMRPFCNINIDMIGRNASDELHITPTSSHDEYNGLTRLAEKHIAAEGFRVLKSADAYWRRSDHKNYCDNLGIPVAFLFAEVHEDYHKPTDTIEKIDYDKMRRVSRLVVRMLHDLQVDRPDL